MVFVEAVSIGRGDRQEVVAHHTKLMTEALNGNDPDFEKKFAEFLNHRGEERLQVIEYTCGLVFPQQPSSSDF